MMSPRIATAISQGGIGTSDILSGMMIGAENGNIDATRASVLVGLSIAGWMNNALLTMSTRIGASACCASCSLLTVEPTAAYSDE